MKVGILIVGSLYWDNCNRAEWRKQRLKWDEKHVVVRAPIRYGKISRKRGDTYTMVFSSSMPRDQWGSAKVVPCQHDVSSFEDLKLEAQWLWAAERNHPQPSQSISGDWGCVGLMPSHSEVTPQGLIEEWKCFVSEKPGRQGFPMPCSRQVEDPAVDSMGLFFYSDSKTDAFPFDLVLATATEPSYIGNRYATPQEIAKLWIEDFRKNPDDKNLWNVKYFCLNREAGITTFQDDEIQEYLRQEPLYLGHRTGYPLAPGT